MGYKGSAPLLNDLMGGQILIAVDTFDTQLAQHQAGKLRVLAISSIAAARWRRIFLSRNWA